MNSEIIRALNNEIWKKNFGVFMFPVFSILLEVAQEKSFSMTQ